MLYVDPNVQNITFSFKSKKKSFQISFITESGLHVHTFYYYYNV